MTVQKELLYDGERCDIEEIGVDDMITFRVLENIRNMVSSVEIDLH